MGSIGIAKKKSCRPNYHSDRGLNSGASMLQDQGSNTKSEANKAHFDHANNSCLAPKFRFDTITRTIFKKSHDGHGALHP
jgi:hypothetical protein